MKNLFILFTVIISLFIFTNFKVNIYAQDNSLLKGHDVFPDNPNIKVMVPDFITPLTNESVVFGNVNISNNPAPQNEPSVRISRKNPNIVVAAWRDFRLGIDPTAVRRVGYSRSIDGGMTWSVAQLLDSTLLGGGLLRNSDATVGTDTAGNFYVGVIALTNTNGNGTLAIYKSTDQGITFPTAVIMAQTGSEDKEYITTDFVPNSPFKNTLYMSWTRFSGATGIKLTKSTNNGLTWSVPVAVSDQSGGGQGSDPAVGVNGDVYVVWQGGNQILFDKSTDGGVSFGVDRIIATGNQPPNLPNGVVTFPSIATDIGNGLRNSTIYVTFCDSRNVDADIFLVKSTDRGATWSTPLRVNNDAIGNGKLQYWPWIAVNEAGIISILFMDNRNTGSNTIVEAWLARSNDRGQTFTNELLSSQPTPTAIPGSNVRFGDYIGIDYFGGNIVPVWTDERAGGFNMDIYTAVVNTPLGITPLTNFPDKFELKQNYPNPFNPGTTIWFSVAKPSFISLSIYNELGQLLETPVNESLLPGNFSIKWDGSKYSSGVYFYKLASSDGFIETKKMLLTK